MELHRWQSRYAHRPQFWAKFYTQSFLAVVYVLSYHLIDMGCAITAPKFSMGKTSLRIILTILVVGAVIAVTGLLITFVAPQHVPGSRIHTGLLPEKVAVYPTARPAVPASDTSTSAWELLATGTVNTTASLSSNHPAWTLYTDNDAHYAILHDPHWQVIQQSFSRTTFYLTADPDGPSFAVNLNQDLGGVP